MKRYVWALCAALLTAACTDDAELQPSVPENVDEETLPAGTVAVPLTVTLGTDWDTDAPKTREAPPDQRPGLVNESGLEETKDVDRVRVIAFRRRILDDIIVTEGTDTSFVYDPSNDQTLTCTWQDGTPDGQTPTAHTRKEAKGTLKKTYGYEYRVVALAYSTSRTFADTEGVCPASGEQNVFDFNLSDGLKFQDFKATVKTKDVWEEFLTGGGIASHKTANLTRKIVFVPQFFYGYCHTGGGNPVIPYAEDGEQLDGNGDPEQVIDKPFTGLLYRGVAKLELSFRADNHKGAANNGSASWCALLATGVNTEVGLTDYDDFLSPGSAVTGGGGYTMIDRVVSLNELTGDRIFNFTAYVLPGKMKLGIRVKYDAISEYIRMRNGKIVLQRGNESSAENATGIIASDVNGEEFYFRRNHKYVFGNPEESDTCPLCYDLTEKHTLE